MLPEIQKTAYITVGHIAKELAHNLVRLGWSGATGSVSEPGLDERDLRARQNYPYLKSTVLVISDLSLKGFEGRAESPEEEVLLDGLVNEWR